MGAGGGALAVRGAGGYPDIPGETAVELQTILAVPINHDSFRNAPQPPPWSVIGTSQCFIDLGVPDRGDVQPAAGRGERQT